MAEKTITTDIAPLRGSFFVCYYTVITPKKRWKPYISTKLFDYESKGRGFESRRAHSLGANKIKAPGIFYAFRRIGDSCLKMPVFVRYYTLITPKKIEEFGLISDQTVFLVREILRCYSARPS